MTLCICGHELDDHEVGHSINDLKPCEAPGCQCSDYVEPEAPSIPITELLAPLGFHVDGTIIEADGSGVVRLAIFTTPESVEAQVPTHVFAIPPEAANSLGQVLQHVAAQTQLMASQYQRMNARRLNNPPANGLILPLKH